MAGKEHQAKQQYSDDTLKLESKGATSTSTYYAQDASSRPKLYREKSLIKPKVKEYNTRRNEDFGGGNNRQYNNQLFQAQGNFGIRSKPSRELYRPPLMGSECAAPNLNPTAKEFAPIISSRSCDLGTKIESSAPRSDMKQDNIVLNRTGLTITVPGNRPQHPSLTKSRSVSSQLSLERSEMRGQIDLNLFAFPLEVIATLSKALEDPNRVPSRSLMELVKQIISRVISGAPRGGDPNSRIPQQAAKLCIGIIEKEDRETFLESLINSCQELYHDREVVLRRDVSKWNSFITFLNEMYGMLKRKQLHFLTKYEGIPPKLVLLSLLAECCTATLTSSLQSTAEVETMFVVLTQIGRDLEAEVPGRMSLLVTCLREAFLNPNPHPQIGKTLLQLIELRAAGWNLPAQAVMYYYPGNPV